ncbi:carboxylating nicotinate-nucleotide diphosphorylase [Defluviitoga tunisiensis]|jgi:nicotinate-nucleotide pyrophosphorylase (carboxylating)|uniref:Probable nicotinate-nucleotide pyrophosphorylase [carboxylating] n=1 Tax=Defluviitoga tunisiensis TaxID=1006576 RepID=A0A0C7NIS2_DEFTU|nr:carboxylating nicotinate-nucleotide diphosphorylase [Defluviitoga tunisiensis]CEP77811.1 nicotinate-nucleotide pyrophosphorylase [Defluviitoga tunisiensis]
MIPLVDKFVIKKYIENFLEEDIGWGDITTDLLIDHDIKTTASIKAKEEGVIAGLDVLDVIFQLLDSSITFIKKINDGDEVVSGDIIAEVKGPINKILKGERLCLNLLQRMSGIATYTRHLCNLIKPYKAKVTDTRKTVPGLRYFDRYAVVIGGGVNHRYNLSDSILIKDNHIKLVGGIKEALIKVKAKASHTQKIEIEVQNLNQFQEALKYGADIILLDNMSIDSIRKAVEVAQEKVILEASGNINESNIVSFAETGVNIISCGALTHSVKALDINMIIE